MINLIDENKNANVRKLATIARITKIDEIDGSLNLELATIRGWKVVVKKGEFTVGSLCVYIEVDSVLPDGLPEQLQVEWKELQKLASKAKTEDEKNSIKSRQALIVSQNTRPEFEFLRERKFRIKTKEIFGQISQGICFPLTILPTESQWHINELETARIQHIHGAEGAIGMDVTEILGVTQYVAPINTNLDGIAIGDLAQVGILVSDEERIENLIDRYEQLKKFKYSKSEKLEGCLDENTLIETEDGIKTIKDICINKYSGSIKSFDIQTNEVVFSKINGHSINNKKKKWFKIELNNDTEIVLTENHEIWIPKLMCWRRVDELDGTEEFLIN